MKNLLKKNKLMSLLVINIGAFLFKVIQKLVKIDEKQVLFVSFAGKQFSDSPKTIYNYLKNNDEDLKLLWAFKNPEKFDVENKLKINSIKYFFVLAKSKYWISNASIERLIPLNSENHVYINTWHGTPLKKLGMDDEKSDFLVKNWYENANIDYLTVSSDYDFKVFKKIFPKVKHFIKGGLPRNELLYKVRNDKGFSEKLRTRLNSELKLDKSKKTILYAPTFRDTKTLAKNFEQVLNDNHFNQILDKYNVLFRGHYFSKTNLKTSMIDVSNYPDINELFIVADILITDYSSVLFDFSILNKKIVLFCPDYVEYVGERGFYMEPKKLDLPFFNNIVDLVKYLKEFDTEEDASTDIKSNFYYKFNAYPFNSISSIIELVVDGC